MFIEDFKYPFRSIIEEIPGTIDDSHATQLSNKYQRALVSFFTWKKNSKRELILCGSGFLLLMPGAPNIVIITASHVVTDLINADFRAISIDGENYPFEKVNVLHNSEQDYALVELPKAIFDKEKTLPYFDLNYRTQLTPLRSFMITGYPGSRNTFHIDRDSKGLNRLNLIFHSFGFDTETEDIFFKYNDKKGKKGTQFTPEPLSDNNNLPNLEGMSGGVISQIMIDLSKDSLSLRPVGIFKEHLKKKHFLVGNTFIPFADELKKYL